MNRSALILDDLIVMETEMGLHLVYHKDEHCDIHTMLSYDLFYFFADNANSIIFNAVDEMIQGKIGA